MNQYLKRGALVLAAVLVAAPLAAQPNEPPGKAAGQKQRRTGRQKAQGAPKGPGKAQNNRAAQRELRQQTAQLRDSRVKVRKSLDEGDVEAARNAARQVAAERSKLRKKRGDIRPEQARALLERKGTPEQRRERAERVRRSRWMAIKARYRAPNASPTSVTKRLRNELRRHAKRMAQIQRLRLIAEANENMQVLERVDALEELERARHERSLRLIGNAAIALEQAADAAEEAADELEEEADEAAEAANEAAEEAAEDE